MFNLAHPETGIAATAVKYSEVCVCSISDGRRETVTEAEVSTVDPGIPLTDTLRSSLNLSLSLVSLFLPSFKTLHVIIAYAHHCLRGRCVKKLAGAELAKI